MPLKSRFCVRSRNGLDDPIREEPDRWLDALKKGVRRMACAVRRSSMLRLQRRVDGRWIWMSPDSRHKSNFELDLDANRIRQVPMMSRIQY